MTSVNEIIESIDGQLRAQLKEYKYKKDQNADFDLMAKQEEKVKAKAKEKIDEIKKGIAEDSKPTKKKVVRKTKEKEEEKKELKEEEK